MKPLDRRRFLNRIASGMSLWAAAGIPGLTKVAATPWGSGVFENPRQEPDGLAEPAFRPLPLGSIRPRGWLGRQLRIQAEGLTGHLDEFWPDVARSQWFGGDAEGWERAPYWLDGAIPLAYVLDDERLKTKVAGRVDEIVHGQRPDGVYGPVAAAPSTRPYDAWAILLANKILVQYHEATGDERTLRAVAASLRALGPSVARTPLFTWGRYRWFEGLIPIFYVYERTRERWLLDLARTLRGQGTDYTALYAREAVTVPTPRGDAGRWTSTW